MTEQKKHTVFASDVVEHNQVRIKELQKERKVDCWVGWISLIVVYVLWWIGLIFLRFKSVTNPVDWFLGGGLLGLFVVMIIYLCITTDGDYQGAVDRLNNELNSRLWIQDWIQNPEKPRMGWGRYFFNVDDCHPKLLFNISTLEYGQMTHGLDGVLLCHWQLRKFHEMFSLFVYQYEKDRENFIESIKPILIQKKLRSSWFLEVCQKIDEWSKSAPVRYIIPYAIVSALRNSQNSEIDLTSAFTHKEFIIESISYAAAHASDLTHIEDTGCSMWSSTSCSWREERTVVDRTVKEFLDDAQKLINWLRNDYKGEVLVD